MAECSPLLLLRRHTELAELYDDGNNGNFLSGWQCVNPWSATIIERIAQSRAAIDASAYQSLNDDCSTHDRLRRFHNAVDHLTPEAIFCGEGSSSISFSFCAWLKQNDIAEVFYIPPLYFALHFSLRFFGIHARPISGRQAYDSRFGMNLPPERGILLFSDPIWYAGIPLDDAVVDDIAKWQRRTGSLIFVDGSFQYMRWDGLLREATARLDPLLTMRLICPSKALAMHGYRFAYATLPATLRVDLVQLYTYIYGSDSADSVAFARIAADELENGRNARSLTKLVAERHRHLRDRRLIGATWQASCGYFVFERINVSLPTEMVLMDGSYFEQRRYKDHYRINLLSPSIELLS
jgi:aspartate/methionine/tyrosine aminotransferase